MSQYLTTDAVVIVAAVLVYYFGFRHGHLAGYFKGKKS